MKLVIGYTAMASLPGIAEKYPAKDRDDAEAAPAPEPPSSEG